MSDDAFEEARSNFAKEIGEKIPPRDQKGQFIAETSKPERMFAPREIEGDLEDGGDDPRLSTREREIADGRVDERAERQSVKDSKNLRRTSEDDGDLVADEDEREDVAPESESDSTEEEGLQDEGPKYEIIVEGEPRQVTLQEALRGYVRQETFAKYVVQLQEFKNQLETSHRLLQQNWEIWDKNRRDFEEDVANMLPKEPNWDEEFAKDPRKAHADLKVFQAIAANLMASRSARAAREQEAIADRDRQVEKYAVDGRARFVFDNKDYLVDEATVQRNLRAMRNTAASAGFSEYEIATVYDPRMLTILLKASRWDRLTAKKPQAIIPGKGRTLTPGAATPLGNRRSGLDDAQRRLARTGKLDDAAEVFRRIL